jgi:hypothetical protein
LHRPHLPHRAQYDALLTHLIETYKYDV